MTTEPGPIGQAAAGPAERERAAEGVEPATQGDLDAVRRQLGRLPRGVVGVGHRCPCGQPDVLVTAPRLPDGTPFPTTFYATCPRLCSAIGTLEADGVMREMSERLGDDPDLAAAYARAHDDYLDRRAALGDDVPEIGGISAGGMPTRVKCLHVLVGHALSAGRGVNVLGDEALDLLPRWWAAGPCATDDAAAGARDGDEA